MVITNAACFDTGSGKKRFNNGPIFDRHRQNKNIEINDVTFFKITVQYKLCNPRIAVYIENERSF